MQILIQNFTQMRIRIQIQLSKIMRIHADSDPDPEAYFRSYSWGSLQQLEHLTADDKVANVLGSIPASFDTVESGGRQMKKCWKKTYLALSLGVCVVSPVH
jgi:hypothetical protein